MNTIGTLLRAMLASGVLFAMQQAAHAQLSCGVGSADGATTQCNTDGMSFVALRNPITLHAPADGKTIFEMTAPQGKVSGFEMSGTGLGDIEVIVRAHLRRNLDFTGLQGDLLLHVQAPDASDPQAPPAGLVLGNSQLGSGASELRIDAGAVLSFEANAIANPVQRVEVDFGGSDSVVTNSGYFMVGHSSVGEAPLVVGGSALTGPPSVAAREITLDQLQRFENRGAIVLGGIMTGRGGDNEPVRPAVEYPAHSSLGLTDYVPSTVLALPGADFVGAPGSIIHFDAVFRYGESQQGCDERTVRSSHPNGLPQGNRGQPHTIDTLIAADCVDLRGGRTSGVTEVAIYDWQPGTLAANFGDGGIVLVDAEGGESAAEHFVLSPQSDHYDPDAKALQQGFVMFPLVYDADRQQHKLVSLPGARALALPHLMQSLQAVARVVGDEAGGRQGRAAAGDGGTWVRLSQRQQSRDVRHGFQPYGQAVTVDGSHQIDSTVFTVGRSWAAGAWALGGAISYVDARVDFDANSMRADMGGASIALHADYRDDGLFFDNLVQLQWLEMDVTDPSLDVMSRGQFYVGYAYFDPSTAYRNQVGDSSTQSIHLRSEVGLDYALNASLQITPLMGLSWVRAEAGEATMLSYDNDEPGNRFFGDHADSLRATVGGRAAFTRSGARLNLRATGSLRYWQSLKDKTTVTLANAGPDLVVQDDFDGGWTEVNAGLELVSPSGRVAGQLEAQALLGDYEGYGVTAGVRFQW